MRYGASKLTQRVDDVVSGMTTPTSPVPAEVIGFSRAIAEKLESKLPGVMLELPPEAAALGAAEPGADEAGAAVGAVVGAAVAGAVVAVDEQPARIAATATIAAAVFFVCKSKLLLRKLELLEPDSRFRQASSRPAFSIGEFVGVNLSDVDAPPCARERAVLGSGGKG